MRTKTLLTCGLLLMQLSCAKQTPKPQEAPSGINLQAQLLEPGAEPREQLRYKRADGLTENLIVELSLATLLETTGASALVEAPVLALGLTMGEVRCTTAPEPLCNYPFRFRVIGVKMPEGASEDAAAELGRAVAPLGAVTGTFEVDSRGVTRRADVDVPPGVPPRLLTLLGNIRTSLISVPMPEEAVGVGARWQVQRLHNVGKIKTTQTLVYSLLERKDRVLRLGVTLRQSADPQEVAYDEATSLKVESYEFSGTGSMVMNLDALTPLSEIRGNSELRGTVSHGTQSEALAVAGSIEAVVAPLPADALQPSSPGGSQ
jgi:hypothetical protein